MANVKINVIHPKVYGTDGKLMELGEQSVDSKLAEKLLKRKVAEKANPKNDK